MEITFDTLPETRDWAKKMHITDHVQIKTPMWNGFLGKRFKDGETYDVCLNHVHNYGIRDRAITFFHTDLEKVVDKIESILWHHKEPNTERLRINL